MNTDKTPITPFDMVNLEKAASLKVIDLFEESLIFDRLTAFKQFGFKMVMTDKQRAILKGLAERYDRVHKSNSPLTNQEAG